MTRRSRRRRNWSWPGAVALVLACGLALGWGGSILLASTPWTESLTQHGADLLSGLGQVMAGALATYLGAQVGINAGRDSETRRESDAEPPLSDEESGDESL
jgi:hypothetical protein